MGDPAEERPHGMATGLWARFGALAPAERVAAAGALTVIVSLLLPWYGLKLIEQISQTGIDAFSWGQGALVLIQVAALALILVRASGRQLPRPISAGILLVLAGTWSAIVVGYLMVDRPDAFDPLAVKLRFGIFVAMAGAVAVIVGGARLAAAERRERRRPSPGPDEADLGRRV